MVAAPPLKPNSTQNTQSLYEQALRFSLSQRLAGEEPEWLLARRQQAFSRYEALGFPHSRQETWRYIDLKPVAQTAYAAYETPVCLLTDQIEKTLLTGIEGVSQAPIRLVFLNGHYQPALSDLEALPEQVIVTDLNTALRQHPHLLEQHLAVTLPQESDAFAALNGALFTQGALVYVPDNISLDRPLQVLFLSTSDGKTPHFSYTRGLFILGKQAKAQILVQFEGLESSAALHNFVSEAVIGESAQLEYTFLQEESNEALQFATTKLFLQAKSTVRMTSVAVEGALTRNNIEADLLGEEGLCCLNGLSILAGTSQAYQLTTVNHLVPRGESHQLYKTIAADHSRAEFNGTIFVAKGAQLTDSTQLSKNLMLSDDARIFTRPQLRIDADDVKCNHGATVGQLEDEQLFYLTSRGLDEQAARNLLTYGFAEDVVEKITHPLIRQHVEAVILHQLHPKKYHQRAEA